MKLFLRAIAVAVAVAATVDPAIARRTAVPLPVDVLLPPGSDPLFEKAVEIREQIARALGNRVDLDGPEVAQAVIALGRATLPESSLVPLFGLTLTGRPAVAIEAVKAPAAIHGQSAPVVAMLHAAGLAGRTTFIALERSGSAIESIEHQWKTDDETFVARLGFVPAAAGVHRLRVAATTSGLEPMTRADVAVVVRERRLRVLAYEARPSWPLAFVRRSLEADPLFDVTTTVRTTSRSATTSAGAPTSLAALQAEHFDAVIVGSPEALSAAEVRALDTFVSTRGGALLLLPDRRLTESVRRGFGLPELEEVILERPLTTAQPAPTLRASELLLAPRDVGGVDPLALVRHGADDRTVVASLLRGAGRIVVSGALDAWRYRADPEAAFDIFWRALVADAAAAAPPRVAVSVEPPVVRPGDAVIVSVSLRPTEFDQAGEAIDLPAIKAELIAGEGGAEMIRLWPGAAPGTYEGRTRAPRAGAYLASVSVNGASADAPLLIADDVIHAASRSSRALAFAAASSVGALVADVDELTSRMTAMTAADVEQRTRPMRSPWWILPFAGALCAEWALRRRGGGR